MEHDLAIILLATLLLAVLRLLPEFRILVSPTFVRCAGAPLRGYETAVEYFFRTVLAYRGTLTVTGRQTHHGRLKLRFRGKISDHDRRRVYEFLTALAFWE